MCGILGIIDLNEKNINKKVFKRAANLLSHRGPDDSDFYFSNNIALGHRRLSIIDLRKNARQPMSNKSGNMQIIYNGEVYNFQEIRKKLERKYDFKSNSDTEVILHAYEEYGKDCVNLFNGMFAFAIWDESKKELFMARDRAGVKPIYYYQDKSRLIFASEIKSILDLLKNMGIRNEINSKILYDYLNYFILIGQETLFKSILSFPASNYARIKVTKNSMSELKPERYWDFNYNRENQSPKYYQEILKNLLKDSVKKRMISDVPIGSFLSGGLDSSMITAMMNEEIKKNSGELKTFSVAYEIDNEENENAEFISGILGTKHYSLSVSSEEFIKKLPSMIYHYDHPISFASSIPLYFLSKLTKGKAKVILTGEGADELFAGYNRYYLMKKAKMMHKRLFWLGKIKNLLFNFYENSPDPRYRKFAEMGFKGFNEEYSTGLNIFIGKEREQIIQTKQVEKNNMLREITIKIMQEKDTSFLNKLLYLDYKTYLVELLMKQDRMSMAASIESRVPFLDYRITELASNLPEKMKMNKNIGKVILRQIGGEILPKEIIKKKKIGFNVPINRWFKLELKDYLKQELSEIGKESVLNKMFKKEYIEKIISKQINSRDNYSLQTWALLNLKLWHQEFFT
jgi:asparagine synthase (glutamine-hydrolysing)